MIADIIPLSFFVSKSTAQLRSSIGNINEMIALVWILRLQLSNKTSIFAAISTTLLRLQVSCLQGLLRWSSCLIDLWKILQALLKLTRLVQCFNPTKHGRGNKGKTRKEDEKERRKGEGKEPSSIEGKHPDESGGNTEGAMGWKKPMKRACVRHDSRP